MNRAISLPLVLVVLLVSCLQKDSAEQTEKKPRPGALGSRALERSLSFEANVGQTDPAVHFLARSPSYTTFINGANAVVRFAGHPPDRLGPVLRMRLLDANAGARPTGRDPLSTRSNYFHGSNPRAWRVGVPHFARVRYKDVYPNVDLDYHADGSRLEVDFIVAPQTDPALIRLAFDGADAAELSPEGDLVLHMGRDEVRWLRPRVYQEVDAARHPIDCSYVITDTRASGAGSPVEVSFRLANAPRPDAPLVIDPTLEFSTYLGGKGIDTILGVTVDDAGNIYLAGQSTSLDFPGAGPKQPRGHLDAFVMKLDATGSSVVFSAFFGGSRHDGAAGIALDGEGNVYLAGGTHSFDFPTVNAFQPVCGCGDAAGERYGDAFVAKLSPDGSSILYSTYLGGATSLDTPFPKDDARGLVVDADGFAYSIGVTTSNDFPTEDPIQATKSGGWDAFVTKLSQDGSKLVYSTYLGGTADDYGWRIALDGGRAHIVGETMSDNFPLRAPLLSRRGGGTDAFVAALNATTSQLVYSTYLGGSGDDIAYDVAIDLADRPTVVGVTTSTDFPTANAAQSTNRGSLEAFATRLDTNGASLLYSTYLGGSEQDGATGVALDATGRAIVTGVTFSPDFPTVASLQPAKSGISDAFLAVLGPNGSPLRFSTYLGGLVLVNYETVAKVVADRHGNAILTGSVLGTGFPTTEGALQRTYGGELDSFVAKIRLGVEVSVSTTTINAGGLLAATWTSIASPTADDWIGLYTSPGAADTAYLSYRYTKGQASGALPFTIPGGAAPGTTYELRLFSNGGYTRLATSSSFTVQVATLGVSPTMVAPGWSVAATWTSIASPTASDWIGLYASSGVGNTAYLSYRYTNGQASGALPFTIPGGAAPGTTYELRLFSNNGYTRLAASNNFTIQATTPSTYGHKYGR